MKQIYKQSLCIIVVFFLSIACSKKTIPSSEVNFISGNAGTVTMRAVGIGANQKDAIVDAEKNAFNVLFFRGLPESEVKNALVGTNESMEKEKHKDYFDKFYKDKRYKSFLMSTIPVSDLVKSHSGLKSISVDVKINLVALRKDLEEFGVIRKFGY